MRFEMKPRSQFGKNAEKRKNTKSWYNGKLITKAEHDKLSIEEVHAWNNRITTSKKKKS